MDMDIDLDGHFREQDKRMNMPDEGVTEYMARVASRLVTSSPVPETQGLNASASQEGAIWNIGDVEPPRTRAAIESPAESNYRNLSQHDNRSDLRHDESGTTNFSLKRKAAGNEDAARKRSKHSHDSRHAPNLDGAHDEPSTSIPEIGKSVPTSRSALARSDLPSNHLKEASLSLGDRAQQQSDLSSREGSPSPKRQSLEPVTSLQPRPSGHVTKSLSIAPASSSNSVQNGVKVTSVPKLQMPPLDVDPRGPKRRKPTPDADTRSVDPPTSPIEEFSEYMPPPPAKPRVANVSAPTKATVKKPKAAKKEATTLINARKVERAQTTTELDPIVISDDESPAASSSRPVVRAPQLSFATVKTKTVRSSKSGVVKTTKTTSKKGKAKEKPPLMTPPQYVQMLRDKLAAGTVKFEKSQSLAGLNLFYTGGDMTYASERTRAKMELIVKHGGNLLPEYDATTVTHIVTDAQMYPTLRALGLKKLNQIPNHIPTVTWNWVVGAMGKGSGSDKTELYKALSETWMHAAFALRFDAGAPSIGPSARKGQAKGKAKEAGTVPDGADFSRISEFTPEKSASNLRALQPRNSEQSEVIEDASGAPLSPPTSPRRVIHREEASSSKVQLPVHKEPSTSDPLAEFYAQARAEREAGKLARSLEAGESDVSESEVEVVSKAPQAKRGFTCDKKDTRLEKCPNQDIIDKLQELLEIHQTKPGQEDRWRVLSYSKSIRALRAHPKRIRTLNEARNLQGVGEKTAVKIMEIIETGKLRRIQFERTEDVEVARKFQGIYGVGQSTAQKWYANGCRTLEDLTSGKYGIKLTPAQEIGIRYYDDINSRMPRSEAKAIFDLIKPMALEIDPDLFVEIMGSYRRGKTDCGDIDILITRNPDDGRTHAGILPRLLPALHEAGILTEDLALPDDPSEEEVIYRGLCHLPQEGSRQRRIDFLTVPWKSRGAALLYYTGDDIFNRAMRLKANVLGYSLNQRGLFSGVVRDPRDRRVKLNQGTLMASETEEEIFRILGVPWQEPHERVRG